MKNNRKMLALLAAAAILVSALVTGCGDMTEPGDTRPGTDAPDAAVDAPSTLTLPILDEINRTVTPGTAGSSLLAVQEAVKLLDWGANTGLDVEEIEDAAAAWLSQQGDERDACIQKLSLVDDAYQQLLGDGAQDLLDSAGCADTEISWSNEPLEPVEAIMKAAGLR